MADKEQEAYNKYKEDLKELKLKYPKARMSAYIDKQKQPPETPDSEQGKVSKAYGKIVDEYNQPKFKDMMEKSRSRAVEASDESQGFLSKILPTYKAGANKDFKRAIADFKNIPEYARNKEAYNDAGYKKGGSIRGCGCETKGKTKGRFV